MHAGETIFENNNVVARVRNLTILVCGAWYAGCQRISRNGCSLACGDWPVHARGGHWDPLAGERVAAHDGRLQWHEVAVGVPVWLETVGQRARVVQFARLCTGNVIGLVVEVEEIASVGEVGVGNANVLALVRCWLVVARSVGSGVTHGLCPSLVILAVTLPLPPRRTALDCEASGHGLAVLLLLCTHHVIFC